MKNKKHRTRFSTEHNSKLFVSKKYHHALGLQYIARVIQHTHAQPIAQVHHGTHSSRALQAAWAAKTTRRGENG